MTFSGICEELLVKCNSTGSCACAVWVLCFSTVCYARAMQAPEVPSPGTHVAVRSKAGLPALTDTVALSASRKDQSESKTQSQISASDAAATSARVILENGVLTIQANNSELSQILKDVADVSGMTIDGTIRPARVYGVYGPRNPRDVLTSLLVGAGYNFMMVGVTHDGSPRELVLTPQRASAALPTILPLPALDVHANSDADAPEREEPGPGAILHVPPPAPEDPQVRVQQNLQRLKQMHERQSQQNAPQ